MKATDIVMRNEHIILFDGICNLCSNWVQFVYQRDPQANFRFASVQSPTGQTLLTWCGLPTTHYKTMVYIERGEPHFKSDAFLRIVRLLRKPWPILTIGQLLPTYLRDWAYDRIALNRYQLFGKRPTCFLPTGELAGRFI